MDQYSDFIPSCRILLQTCIHLDSKSYCLVNLIPLEMVSHQTSYFYLESLHLVTKIPLVVHEILMEMACHLDEILLEMVYSLANINNHHTYFEDIRFYHVSIAMELPSNNWGFSVYL